MQTVVIYKSLSGFTKKYATWIAKELNADLLSRKEIKIEKLKSYDTIIYGGSLHAVHIAGLKKIKSHFEKLKNKNIIVFATGAAPKNEGIVRQLSENNFSKEERKQVKKVYYLRGGFDKDKLPFFYRFIMGIFVKKLKKKETKTEDERGMIEAYETPVDFTEKENIEDLINLAKSFTPSVMPSKKIF